MRLALTPGRASEPMSPDSTPAESAGARSERPRVGYLGPEGTFSEEALLASAEPARSSRWRWRRSTTR